jgi:hypothetical protein
VGIANATSNRKIQKRFCKCVLEFNFASIRGPGAFTFSRKGQNRFVLVNMYFLPVIRYNSSQTKCSGYNVSITNSLSLIVTSYLGITEQNQVVSHYTVARSFQNMIITNE